MMLKMIMLLMLMLLMPIILMMLMLILCPWRPEEDVNVCIETMKC